ncbi:MAG: GNAT family N-acetyltransferase [Phycisphaera sp. RhM]|nr:GNAT family N-acetyltransferase [Phycisphaera sp. RhM]
MITLRLFQPDDWPSVWQILEPVFRAGETYPYSTNITEAEARAAWIDVPAATFVAMGEHGDVLGTYYIKPNQADLGSHVANCGYLVGEAARGRGIASTMCEHSQAEAVARGFKAMQYNLVVSTNERAVKLWQHHGFEIVGTLPKAFRHRKLGYVDAYVMYKWLAPAS